MRVAGFRDKSSAQAAAAILRDHGYLTEIVGIEGEPSPSRVRDLPESVLKAEWAQALVLSNCESEYFRDVVVDNCGVVLWQHRPGRFRQSEYGIVEKTRPASKI